MGNQDQRGADLASHGVEPFEDLVLNKSVERSRRLVRNKDLRAQRQRRSDYHTLAHAPAQFVRVHIESGCRQVEREQHLRSPLACSSTVEFLVMLVDFGDLAPHAVERIERCYGSLRNERQLLPSQPLQHG